MMTWSYGVTAVSQRVHDGLLRRTLCSLAQAGFDRPRLFVDGCEDWEMVGWRSFGLPLTVRHDPLKTAGNWVLSLYELYYRDPDAQRYIIFQDDFVTYKNLKRYLEILPYPKLGYCNLYTFPSNQSYCPAGVRGWFLSRPVNEANSSMQTGRGAVALMFDKKSLLTLLSQRSLVERVQDSLLKDRKIDGGIVNAMNLAGYKEYCHNPSLVQHTGLKSSMGNLPHPEAVSFLGENYDALDLLQR